MKVYLSLNAANYISYLLWENIRCCFCFPIKNDFFRSLTFTIFYARLEDHKNILKFELPYFATEDKIKDILKIIKNKSAEGYPLLLKKAHNDVIIRNVDLERLSKIIGFMEKSGREMLWIIILVKL